MVNPREQKIYLAGFDVFRLDASDYGKSLHTLCAQYGFQGLFPLDNQAPANLTGRALADWIYNANIALIHQADLVMANVNNFRGAEPDSGTCFEIGFARALGKSVWAYTDDGRPLVDQIKNTQSVQNHCVDEHGLIVEDFGLVRNLMIACSSELVIGGPEDCLRAINLRSGN
ncbi:nucleoside 2-deoxyribosyltransferase [Herbaspirillum sp. Sphag1AN]|uniref:nucleoside 2-deoxyribosyltransferase n=1 Tax=unclassified Herbaspirillum TaxID=2624150 RepID=UPI00161B90E2|nr:MULTISPECIES: nucleoside 2-deoxyribosyltransferase [unclassified Herbaspirillum]MBB3213678.1 nucleoside 2-deoxyribosyltransferase [Herbaspirillum sp. Sphag1AN]MBB3246875.1 nucleoside 2-deoxyribosyltransferase [Herbaspirillum sp. Sphag64]